MMPISRRKFVALAIGAVCLALVTMAAGLLAADLYVHRKFENAAGMNIWGYRGPTVGRKRAGEIRIAVLGGSTALGYGLEMRESFPSQLQAALNETGTARSHHFVVVNLGYNNSGAYSFRYMLDDYKYLGYDIVCLYEGYNDLGAVANMRVSRRDSGIFRLTGYYPLLPIVASEKAMQLRHGNLNDAYRHKQVVFRPNLAARTTASALETSISILNAIDEHEVSGEVANLKVPAEQSEGCDERWAFYCHSVAVAVEDARSMNKAVLVVTQPYLNDVHRDQQRALTAMVRRKWADDPLVKHVNLGHAVDTTDLALSWDSMHLTRAGNERVADGLVGPILEMLPRINR